MSKMRVWRKGNIIVRIASRMLGAKLIELYFRLIDRGMFLGVPGGIFFRGEMAD